MKIDGGCHCGAIRFEAEIDPRRAVICHCTDCQRLSGSAYRVVIGARAETFRLLQGEPTTYIKTADSGAHRLQAFCGICGSHLYATAPEGGQIYSLRVGAIDQRAQLAPPAYQIWRKSALDWAQDISALPARDGN